ncbi:MAG: OmpA family protein [bacterium]
MKNRKIQIAILLIMLGVFMQSCIYPPTKQKALDCTVPHEECNPFRYSPGDFDNSRFEIKQLIGLPAEQICQISFSGNNVFITQVLNGKHLIYNSKQTAIDKFALTGKVQSKADYYGLATAAAGKLIYSQLPSETKSGENGLQSSLVEYSLDETYISPVKSLDYLKQSKYEWQSHPALSPDGKMLFFASDRAGGEGGIDIWYSTLTKSGSWSVPVNCGQMINTPCDDMSPCIIGNKLLYASRGHAGFGGTDLFSATLFVDANEVRFGKAENMGPQINTSANEIFPSAPGNIDSLMYFARNTGDNFEMFYRIPLKPFKRDIAQRIKKDTIAVQKKPITENIEPNLPKDYAYFGEVYSQSDLSAIPNANININMPGNDTIIKLVADRKGKFNLRFKKGITYNVSAHSDNYFYDMEQSYVAKNEIREIVEQKFYLPKIAVLRINFPLDVYDKPYEFVLDTNGNLTERSWQSEISAATRDINFALSMIKEIIITGYTDTLNSTSYNYQLGLKRANFVKSQLVQNGIPAKLITVKSMGETNPLPQKPNEPEEIWSQRLRRVTISKVMGK